MADKGNLPSLFQQILQSEENAENRHAQITQINADIIAGECEINSIKIAIDQLQNTVLVNEKEKFFKEQCETEVASHKLQSLKAQEKNMEETIKKLSEENKSKKEKEEQKNVEFLKEMQDFSNKYDPCSKNSDFRKSERLKKLESLKLDLIESEANLSKAMDQQNSLKSSIKTQKSLEQDISKLQKDIIETDSEFESYRKRVQEVKENVESSYHTTSNDPEFIKLQKELSIYDCRLAEENIHCLKAELQKLKREEWQHQPTTDSHRKMH